MKRFKRIISTALVFALGMALMTGCGKKPADKADNTEGTGTGDSADEGATTAEMDNSKKLAVTIGDSEVYLDEMMYFIFMNEYQLQQYDQMYLSYMGTSYWDQEYSEGVTMREYAKTTTMDSAVLSEILYAEALKKNYSLTEEEKTMVANNVKQFMGVITEDQIKLTGLSAAIAEKVGNKLTLSSRYMQDLVDGFDIDDEAIKAGIEKKNYRQYNTQSLFIPTSTVDESGTSKEYSKKDKAAAKKKIEAVVKKAKAGDEFASIVEKNKDLINAENNFVVGDRKVSEEYEAAATPLKNDAVTDVVETKEGYYIIKMINNNSDESYNTACQNAITEEEQKQFATEYEKLKANYKITINEEVWKDIVMGKTTIIEAPAADGTNQEDGTGDASLNSGALDGSDNAGGTEDVPVEDGAPDAGSTAPVE